MGQEGINLLPDQNKPEGTAGWATLNPPFHPIDAFFETGPIFHNPAFIP
jgi:hypothetical protein